ncbi:MAG: hypothetical protein QOJ54_467 [Aliidongia sp.]|jgi:phage-related protein|nr:hypothetical protein [Aliidongia sp.]
MLGLFQQLDAPAGIRLPEGSGGILSAGYQLDEVQRREQPTDFKPFPTIGAGVEELRIRDESGAYRVMYTARLADAVYVLHAFRKKARKTAQSDIDLAKARYDDLMRNRK